MIVLWCIWMLLSMHCEYAIGLPEFAQKIPNSDKVPGIRALGHRNDIGGGPLNAFGRDFRSLGYTWNVQLCELDSDGDGATNGEELGDPCCMGQNIASEREARIRATHPGIVDQFNREELIQMKCSQRANIEDSMSRVAMDRPRTTRMPRRSLDFPETMERMPRMSDDSLDDIDGVRWTPQINRERMDEMESIRRMPDKSIDFLDPMGPIDDESEVLPDRDSKTSPRMSPRTISDRLPLRTSKDNIWRASPSRRPIDLDTLEEDEISAAVSIRTFAPSVLMTISAMYWCIYALYLA